MFSSSKHTKQQYKTPVFALLIPAALFMALYHLLGYAGHFGYDDMLYAQLAHRIASGNFSFTDSHFSYRMALTVPIGIAYRLWGISDSVSGIYPMLITFATGAMIIYAHPKKILFAVALSVSFFFLNHWTLFYADKIMPDSVVALAAMGAFTTFYRYNYRLRRVTVGQTQLHAFVFCAFLMYGFLAKETVWLLTPTLVWLLLGNIKTGKNKQFWLYAIGIGAGMLAAYFALLWALTGNAWARFDAIVQNSYFMPNCSYNQLPWQALAERLSYKLLFAFISGGMATSMCFLLPALFNRRLNALLTLSNPYTYWVMVAFTLLLSGFFMSLSFKHYQPMCPDPRHFLFVIPPIALVAGWEAYRFWGYGQNKLYYGAVLGLFAFIAYTQQSLGVLALVYLPLLALVGLRITIVGSVKQHPILTKGFMCACIGALLMYNLHQIYNAQNNGYSNQKQLIYRFFMPQQDSIVVITNEVQKKFSLYYYGFNTQSHRYLTYKEAQSYTFSPYETVFVVMEGYTQWLSGKGWEHYPKYVQEPPPNFEKQNVPGSIVVYRIPNPSDVVKNY